MKRRERRTLYQSHYCAVVECINDFGEVWVLDTDRRVIGSYVYHNHEELEDFLHEISKRCREKNEEAAASYLLEKMGGRETREFADFGSLEQIFGKDRVYRIGKSAIITDN